MVISEQKQETDVQSARCVNQPIELQQSSVALKIVVRLEEDGACDSKCIDRTASVSYTHLTLPTSSYV